MVQNRSSMNAIEKDLTILAERSKNNLLKFQFDKDAKFTVGRCNSLKYRHYTLRDRALNNVANDKDLVNTTDRSLKFKKHFGGIAKKANELFLKSRRVRGF